MIKTLVKNIRAMLVKGFIQENDIGNLTFRYSGLMRFIPLIVAGGFFFLTILLFVFGPFVWNVVDPWKLYGFLFFCCIALVGGYCLAVFKSKPIQGLASINMSNLVICCSIVYLLLYIPTLIVTTGKWYPDILTGIFDTGSAYRASKYYNETTNPTALYIRMLMSPLTILIMPVTLFFARKLSLIAKIFGGITIVLSVFLSISQGVNKAVADFTAQMVLFLCMCFFSNRITSHKWAYRAKIFFLIVMVCGLFLAYYANGMRNRVSNDILMNETVQELDVYKEKETSQTADNVISDEVVDDAIKQYSTFSVGVRKENYWLDKFLPEKVNNVVAYLVSYLSHGYQGLSYALDMDFTSTYGLGFSDFFRHNFLKVVGKAEMEQAILAQTYQGKISAYGWQTGDVWATFFVFPASDIGFVGTVFLVFLIGYLFALTWKDALTTINPFAITAFWGFTTMIFYFSANNQMFQGGESFIGFTVTILVWLFSRTLLLQKFRVKH